MGTSQNVSTKDPETSPGDSKTRQSSIIFTFNFWLPGSSLLSWAFFSCGDWGLLSSCGTMASLVAEHGPWSARVSVVVAHRLSCPTAHGIFLDQGPNLCPLYWQADSQPLDHQSSVIFGPGTTENHVTEGPDTREDYITPDPVTMEDYTTPDLRTT